MPFAQADFLLLRACASRPRFSWRNAGTVFAHRSVSRSPTEETNVNQNHSTAKQRDKLLEMRRRIAGDVQRTQAELSDEANAAANLSHTPLHAADIASSNAFTDVTTLETENSLLESIDAALARIATGSYGKCDDCGEPIAAARLDALPFATTCTACAEARENAAQ
jgi:DnaK suppressor protein